MPSLVVAVCHAPLPARYATNAGVAPNDSNVIVCGPFEPAEPLPCDASDFDASVSVPFDLLSPLHAASAIESARIEGNRFIALLDSRGDDRLQPESRPHVPLREL